MHQLKSEHGIRGKMIREIDELLVDRTEHSDRLRRENLRLPTTSVRDYEREASRHRLGLTQLLGWPLTEYQPASNPPLSRIPEGEDEFGTWSRLQIPAFDGVSTPALLFLPKTKGPHPAVMAQHGGGGTMDLISGLSGDSANYNDIVDRLRRRGVAVCVPQLMLWGQRVEPPVDPLLDRRFRHLGGSLASFELLRLRRIIDCLTGLPEIDSSQIGMAGLSYGGMFTLYLAALDTRVKSALVSCFFNNRFRYNWEDMVWSGAANHYLDAEVAAMVCPRALGIENGLHDDIFEIGRAAELAGEVAARYEALGLAACFQYAEWNMGHEFHSGNEGINFLLNGLGIQSEDSSRTSPHELLSAH